MAITEDLLRDTGERINPTIELIKIKQKVNCAMDSN